MAFSGSILSRLALKFTKLGTVYSNIQYRTDPFFYCINKPIQIPSWFFCNKEILLAVPRAGKLKKNIAYSLGRSYPG